MLFLIQKSQGFVFTHLDIGGGFPGYDSENELFCKIAKTVNKAINKLFSDHPNLSVFAEPGKQLYKIILYISFIIINSFQGDSLPLHVLLWQLRSSANEWHYTKTPDITSMMVYTVHSVA